MQLVSRVTHERVHRSPHLRLNVEPRLPLRSTERSRARSSWLARNRRWGTVHRGVIVSTDGGAARSVRSGGPRIALDQEDLACSYEDRSVAACPCQARTCMPWPCAREISLSRSGNSGHCGPPSPRVGNGGMERNRLYARQDTTRRRHGHRRRRAARVRRGRIRKVFRHDTRGDT